MALEPITAGFEFAKTVINKIWPNAAEAEVRKLEGFAMEIRAHADEQAQLTLRHQADMASDSWLSKNIRPSVLAFILGSYLVLSVLDGFGFRISEQYIILLGQWGMVVMTFYFGGRTVEKIMQIMGKKNGS